MVVVPPSPPLFLNLSIAQLFMKEGTRCVTGGMRIPRYNGDTFRGLAPPSQWGPDFEEGTEGGVRGGGEEGQWDGGQGRGIKARWRGGGGRERGPFSKEGEVEWRG